MVLILVLVLLLSVEAVIVVNGGLLVLLVFRDQIIHVALSLGELHLVHTLTSVPMQECLATEHRSELLRNPFEELLDGSGVSNEGGRHLEAPGRDVAHCSLDVVRNPLNKVGAVLVLDSKHLLVTLLHGHPSSEDSSYFVEWIPNNIKTAVCD